MLIVQCHTHFQQVQLLERLRVLSTVPLCTHTLTINIFQEVDLVRARSDPLAKHNLTEVLNRRLGLIRDAEVEVVVLKRYDRLFRVESVYVERNFILKIEMIVLNIRIALVIKATPV